MIWAANVENKYIEYHGRPNRGIVNIAWAAGGSEFVGYPPPPSPSLPPNPPNTPPPASPSSSGGSGLSGGAAAGIAIGSVAGVGLLATAFFVTAKSNGAAKSVTVAKAATTTKEEVNHA